jgi:hypothetical protein
MATKPTSTSEHRNSFKKRRRGIHAKTKSSNNKGSKFYKKKYVGQGK